LILVLFGIDIKSCRQQSWKAYMCELHHTYLHVYRDGIRSFIAEANLPKGAKELTRPAVLLSRLPPTRFQAVQRCPRDTHKYDTHTQSQRILGTWLHSYAPATNGNAFLREEERGGGSIGHGARRNPSEGLLARRRRIERRGNVTEMKEEGGAGTRRVWLIREHYFRIFCRAIRERKLLANKGGVERLSPPVGRQRQRRRRRRRRWRRRERRKGSHGRRPRGELVSSLI